MGEFMSCFWSLPGMGVLRPASLSLWVCCSLWISDVV